MIAVLTGDIIGSEAVDAQIWLKPLKELMTRWGASPKIWEIYRGDEFQLKCKVEDAFTYCIAIKAAIKKCENLNVRIGIGIGEESFESEKITESNGSAFVHSGRLLNELKLEGRTLAIKTPDDGITEDLNIVLKWASLQFDAWTPALAEIILENIISPGLTQEELAQKLFITQSSISQRSKRAQLDLLLETANYFTQKIKQL